MISFALRVAQKVQLIAGAQLPGAVTVRSESVQPNGPCKVVSHFNKKYRGELAQAPDDAADAGEMVAIARAAGLGVEETGDTALTLVV